METVITDTFNCKPHSEALSIEKEIEQQIGKSEGIKIVETTSQDDAMIEKLGTDLTLKVKINENTPAGTAVNSNNDKEAAKEAVESVTDTTKKEIEVKVEIAPQKANSSIDKLNEEGVTSKQKTLIVNQIKAIMGMHYLKSDGNPAEILPGFYLGSIGAALNKKGLEELKIGHILCCCDGTREAFPNLFKYKMLKLLDKPDEDITRYFEETADYIHDILSKDEKVLVHCFAGKSRSTTIMISYLIKYHKMTVDQALQLIREKRSVAGPNMGFLQQLRKYEKKLREDSPKTESS